MKLLVQSVLTDVELELLGRLRAELAYKTNTQGPLYPGFKAALDHLIGLHFIEEKYKGAYPAFEARKAESDANEFFRIRNDGKGF